MGLQLVKCGKLFRKDDFFQPINSKGNKGRGNLIIKRDFRGFPGGTVVKNPPANAGDTGSSPGPGRSHMPRSN